MRSNIIGMAFVGVETMFKHNWNGFCWREKYINKHIVYEHTYFNIFIMIPLLLLLMTKGKI